ncbi:glycerol-3-phosphate dehydrogenase/oxidase [Nocardia terpenica]|uniref:Glycerol-3-phosphate dehydrogenase n=1 Tax=Nocardia terpenica TaxID=455432 RepID=A0A164KU26_9NOCA|nr:glycerol-3-phosphate dehydrogenase/oxidase [Nocardia terpenica]KZM71717.1 glycerol-3-phosphate dehydrogenase [Nocardia terpenica]MBF6063361.1 glycerol-3-phosphate dehydrogenase/oxidase [Nocardia terpenica]MBF6105917.1 glycerol-3-phosphate dehydrogenase/oxidase [Nocardia terpenica]MBF6113499.1 glycerol-3-phosphate dehydrogenase/oxidase [Nocardia terpenica]MBF6119658.1 glycerol-3-phosphate dehydrogenase/oxidase [Nocardia terpenica]
MTARLDAAYRAAALNSLGDTEIDVLVIGGGVVGAGSALDAAARGLSVTLVEARDFAAGTSSRSSKLIHGGLRYLEQLDFWLVREALKERKLLLRKLAPHLVHPISFLFPLQHRWERPYIGAGVALYDTMGGAGAVPMHRHLSRTRALELAPALRPDAMTGAIRLFDGQVDDARHTMTIARTAAQHGATVLTRTKVTGLLRAGQRVIGAYVTDLETGREYTVRARRVISATGVWTDEMNKLTGVEFPFHVRTSKGVHILVPRERLDLDTGLMMRTEKSVLFVIPWGRHWIIGTTDTDWSLDKDHPSASAADIRYILDHVNALLREPLTEADIVGTYAGLRPLLSGASSSDTTKLSREHAVAEPVPGLFVIAGGKYTTYRVMAADVVDAAVQGLGRAVAPSVTEHLPLLGAVGYHELLADAAAVAKDADLPVATVQRLLGRYGSAIHDLFELIARNPELRAALPGAADTLAAEVVYAVTHEGALHLDDILTRRTRMSIELADRGVAAAPEIARLIAPHLGWDEATTEREVTRYRDRVAAELAANEALDDETANAARLVASA